MTDLKPLRESSRDDFATELLDSAFLDEPPRHALRRTAVWLGVSEAAVTTLAAGSALGAAPQAMAGALGTKAANGGSAALVAILKWLSAGAVVGVVTAGGFDYATRSAPPPVETVAIPAAPARSKSVQRTQQSESSAARPDPSVSEPAPAAPKPRAFATSTREVERAPALDLEIGQLDRARAALARGKPESALAALDAYAQRRKTLVLDREASVLRIDALLARGDREAAAALARDYVSAHPDDPHARRLRALAQPRQDP
jgi:tetratricopeptide repeat protein